MVNTFLNLSLFLIFHFSMPTFSMKLTNLLTDQSALLALKDHVSYDPENVLATNWSSSTPVCNWFGVSCGSKHHRVTALNLTGLGLVGTLPPHVGNLSFLSLLRIADNNFHGRLPTELSNLQRLKYLDFVNNSFSGEIPFSLGNLPKLEELILSENLISGSIPSSIFNISSLQVILLSRNRLSGSIPDIQQDLPSLEAIYFSFNNLSGHIPGVMFDHVPNLKELVLSANALSGRIPASLFKCSKLQILSLLLNRLEGNLPVEIGNLSMLQFFSIGDNNFQGSIPDTLGNLRNLRRLNLEANNLTSSGMGFLTSFADCPSLQVLSFSDNKWISGKLPGSVGNLSATLQIFFAARCSIRGSIPESVGELVNLIYLDLSENNLFGEIPRSLERLTYLTYFNVSLNRLEGEILDGGSFANWKDVTNLDFSGNNFSGRIPERICDLNSSLRYLGLNDNQLEGALPLSLIHCTDLVILNVANNRLSDTFPHWLGRLPKLRVLILSSNRFHGSIQDSIDTSFFTKLQMVDLSSNDFTGLLPANLFKSLKALREVVEYEYDDYRYSVNVTIRGLELPFTISVAIPVFTCIDLSNNGFHGKIPAEVGELSMLLALNLSHNSLTGPIPTSFGNLTALESLDLSFNKLSGSIPSQLTDLTFLEVLRFQNNNLVGRIPRGKQFETFENDSYSGNLDLCGFPLSNDCTNVEGSETDKHEVKTGKGISFIWTGAAMGYGSGLVLGISMAYVVFTTGRPWWLVRMIERDLKEKIRSWIRKKT